MIVDLDLQFGDVATALQLTPEHGLAEALSVEHLDAMALKTFLMPAPVGPVRAVRSRTPRRGPTRSPATTSPR